MRSDQAPPFANIFLFYYEWQYINNLKKENLIPVLNFCHTFRFKDDLVTINNENFEENMQHFNQWRWNPKKKTKLIKVLTS